MSAKNTTFTRRVEDFFQGYLVSERDLSANTLLSYRDAMKLLLAFTSEKTGRSADRLTFEDFDADRIRGFLDWLASKRDCSNRTLNQRLAAVKSFFRYIASREPEQLDRCRRIREVVNRRVEAKLVGHLEPAEVAQMLEVARSSGRERARDAALMTLMLNSGARVQEIVDLDVESLVLGTVPKVHLRGKGRKQRDCPLWKSTVVLLHTWLAERTRRGLPGSGPLFVNRIGERLGRSGVAYIVARVARAAKIEPAADRERITPHHIRHTTAMELLRSRADITVVAAWLGHATLATTHQYVEIDLRMKQAATAASTAVLPPDLPAKPPSGRLLDWLQRLGASDDYVQQSARKSAKDKASSDELHITDDCT